VFNPTETEFEKPRGVSRVEVRDGYAQVHVRDLTGDINQARLHVLQVVASGGISIDFLKLTPTGLSFLVADDQAMPVGEALTSGGVPHDIRRPRSIVLVHAVNIRDEEGMIAGIVQTLIKTGAPVDHLGDMHDRMLVVVPTEDAHRVADRFRETL
jgi:aspartokinase